MSASPQMPGYLIAHFGRKIAFYVIGQFLPDVLAIDFCNFGWRRHKGSDHPMRQMTKRDKHSWDASS